MLGNLIKNSLNEILNEFKTAGNEQQFRTWVLFANPGWTRAFKCGEKGLELICESPHPFDASPSEQLNLFDNIACWLEEAVWTDAFGRIILVGSSPFLNQLRAALSPAAMARTVSEFKWPVSVSVNEHLAVVGGY